MARKYVLLTVSKQSNGTEGAHCTMATLGYKGKIMTAIMYPNTISMKMRPMVIHSGKHYKPAGRIIYMKEHS